MKRGAIINLLFFSIILVSAISGCPQKIQRSNETNPIGASATKMNCYSNDSYCCLKDSPQDCWIPGELAVQFNENVSGEQALKVVQDLGLKVSPLTAGTQYRNARLTIIDLPKGHELDYSDLLNKTGLVKYVSLSALYVIEPQSMLK